MIVFNTKAGQVKELIPDCLEVDKYYKYGNHEFIVRAKMIDLDNNTEIYRVSLVEFDKINFTAF